jgi:hypothetical protein
VRLKTQFIIPFIVSKPCLFTIIGTKRFLKSMWKPFKGEFKEVEESLSAAKDEITEELQLASEQAAHGFRRLLTTETEENRTLRLKQVAEMQKNEYFRSQQTLALRQTQARQVQKILKEEGNSLKLGEEKEA